MIEDSGASGSDRSAGTSAPTDPTPEPPGSSSGRRCRYSQCRAYLPQRDGRGAPYRYCPDRVWPDGRTCRQMAAAERAAAVASGLDGPLDTFRALADRLAGTTEPLSDLLAQVLDAVDEVADGALSRVGESERAAEAERQRADAAARDAEAAHRARATAEAERVRYQAVAQDAQRLATTARNEADEQIRSALERVASAEADRGRAEATAASAVAGQAEQVRYREVAERRAADLEEQLRAARAAVDAGRAEAGELRTGLDGARARLAELGTGLAAARTRVERAEADAQRLRAGTADLESRLVVAERERTAAGERAATLTAELDQIRGDRERACAEADRLAARVAGLERDTATATATAADAEQRRIRAETLLDRLVAALPGAVPASG